MVEPLKLCTVLSWIRAADSPFTFSRWGDGEWRAVLRQHRNGASNCDGHKFYPEMGQELANVLIGQPQYVLGMQNLAMKLYGNGIQAFLVKHGLTHLRWVESDVFHYGMIKGHQDKIVQAVKSRKLLIVGPPHLKSLKGSGLPYWKYVEVPPRNCYLNAQELFRKIASVIESQRDPLLVSISASMPAEILCDSLFQRFGDQHTFIDFGSLWDPMVGRLSRSYMKNR